MIELEEVSLKTLQKHLTSGELTSVTLTQAYLERIEKYDSILSSIIEINPKALEKAQLCDQRRTESSKDLGLFYGIPILIKDNIDTADEMKTTAGSLALEDAPSPKADAHIVSQLHSAGAIILGKTNMSEWAFARCLKEGISGWSARGGFTKNPYHMDRSPQGSSSGSAVAVSANLTTVAIGTETDGSILSPASANSIVGIKPSVGLVSRAGIIPISFSQDTAGPMARTVADAASLLTVISAKDPTDQLTKSSPLVNVDYTQYLNDKELNNSRIGILDFFVNQHQPKIIDFFNSVIETIKKTKANIRHINDSINLNALAEAELTVLQYEYKDGLNTYLKNRGSKSIRSINDLINFNNKNAETELIYFGQTFLDQTARCGDLNEKQYLQALSECKRITQSDGIDMFIDNNNVDCLIAPTLGVPHLTDTILGDAEDISSSSLAAVAGYPSITVPAGYINGLPIGISFIGKKWSEPKLIAIAHSFEKLTKVRKPPNLETLITK